MDNVTHTLFALTLARTAIGRAGRGTTSALVLASNAPDIDIISAAGGAVGYLHWHRGPTHGPIGIVGLGLATAGLVWMGRKLFERPSSGNAASFGMLAGVSIIGVLLLVLMDLPTSYGTRLFSPFDWHWFALDWIPIVDVYLLIALASGPAFGSRSEKAGRRSAAIVLALMAANYGIRGAAHHTALNLAPRIFAAVSPAGCDDVSRQRPTVDVWPRSFSVVDGCLMETAAIPTFVSPFSWRLIAKLPNAYEVREIHSFAGSGTPESTRYPNEWTSDVLKAANSNVGRVFLGFSRFPAAQSSIDSGGSATVRWADIRFVPANGFFTATVRLDAGGHILQEALGR